MDGLEDLLANLLDLLTNTKTLGALGLAAGFVALLVQTTKLAKVRAWIDTRRWGAWVAVGLGAISGALSALASHKPWLAVAAATLGGALAGLTGVGLYEATAGRSAKRRALALLGSNMSNPPSNTADTAKMKAELETAKGEADEKKRLAAKAAWLDKWLS